MLLFDTKYLKCLFNVHYWREWTERFDSNTGLHSVKVLGGIEVKHSMSRIVSRMLNGRKIRYRQCKRCGKKQRRFPILESKWKTIQNPQFDNFKDASKQEKPKRNPDSTSSDDYITKF